MNQSVVSIAWFVDLLFSERTGSPWLWNPGQISQECQNMGTCLAKEVIHLIRLSLACNALKHFTYLCQCFLSRSLQKTTKLKELGGRVTRVQPRKLQPRQESPGTTWDQWSAGSCHAELLRGSLQPLHQHCSGIGVTCYCSTVILFMHHLIFGLKWLS